MIVDGPETEASAARRREIDKILDRGPREIVGLALDALELAVSADERAERATLVAEAALGELRTLRRRLGIDDDTRSALGSE